MKLCLGTLLLLVGMQMHLNAYDGSVGGEANDDWAVRHLSSTDGSMEDAFIVSLGNPETYVNVRYEFQEAVTVVGLSLSVRDRGAPKTFPMIGLFPPNLRVDRHGNTPDLSQPLAVALKPGVLCGPELDFWSVDLTPVDLPAGSVVHAVVQFPSPSTDFLAVGADTDFFGRDGDESIGSPNPIDSSFYTEQSYTFPARSFLEGEFGIHLLIEEGGNDKTVLRAFRDGDDATGDFEHLSVKPGHDVGLAMWAPSRAGAPTVSQLYISLHGSPVLPIGPVIAMDSNPKGSHQRIVSPWPLGFGRTRLKLVVVSASPSIPGSVQVSNEISLESLPDPGSGFGAQDDSTYEGGWLLGYPVSGPEDYFNVNFGDGQHSTITGMAISVMDFGTWETAFPRVGITSSNDSLDPSGRTPDLSDPYVDLPVPFPALTLCTTTGQMIEIPLDPFQPVSTPTHMFVKHPPDVHYLGLGADIDGELYGLSGFSIDSYRTRAKYRFIEANWGIRLLTQ